VDCLRALREQSRPPQEKRRVQESGARRWARRGICEWAYIGGHVRRERGVCAPRSKPAMTRIKTGIMIFILFGGCLFQSWRCIFLIAGDELHACVEMNVRAIGLQFQIAHANHRGAGTEFVQKITIALSSPFTLMFCDCSTKNSLVCVVWRDILRTLTPLAEDWDCMVRVKLMDWSSGATNTPSLSKVFTRP